jgi:hypothetical protein
VIFDDRFGAAGMLYIDGDTCRFVRTELRKKEKKYNESFLCDTDTEAVPIATTACGTARVDIVASSIVATAAGAAGAVGAPEAK